MANPLSRREVLRFGAFTTVGGVLTPGISLAQAITTDSNGITARDIRIPAGGTTIPAYDARPEAAGLLLRRSTAGLQEGRGRRRLEALPCVLRPTPEELRCGRASRRSSLTGSEARPSIPP